MAATLNITPTVSDSTNRLLALALGPRQRLVHAATWPASFSNNTKISSFSTNSNISAILSSTRYVATNSKISTNTSITSIISATASFSGNTKISANSTILSASRCSWVFSSNSNNYSIGNHFFKVLVQIHYSLNRANISEILMKWLVTPHLGGNVL